MLVVDGKLIGAVALRSRMVVACADGQANNVVAEQLGVAPKTIGKWRARFAVRWLDGLADEPRSGRVLSILLDKVEDIIIATLEEPPQDATHWSRSSMAARAWLAS